MTTPSGTAAAKDDSLAGFINPRWLSIVEQNVLVSTGYVLAGCDFRHEYPQPSAQSWRGITWGWLRLGIVWVVNHQAEENDSDNYNNNANCNLLNKDKDEANEEHEYPVGE